MVYLESLESIIESLYLGQGLTEAVKRSDIFINPSNTAYIAGKVIIINRPDYARESTDQLLRNQCEVISRVVLEDMEGLVFSPYIVRPCFDIMWNGDDIELQGIDDIFDYMTFYQERGKLLMPKFSCDSVKLSDMKGNLTALGWALHQVGVNISDSTSFIDLDVYKTKKV